MSHPQADADPARYVFSQMFSPTVMLLIGGFTIASALRTRAIDRLLITRVLALAGGRPRIVLLAFMAVACFASMWISNVAAPTLCFTLIRVRAAVASAAPGACSRRCLRSRSCARSRRVRRSRHA
jgi:phosphate transporter